MQLPLFRPDTSWWTARDRAIVEAWHRLWAFLDTLPQAPEHYLGEIAGRKERCTCQRCRDFEKGQDMAEQAFDAWWSRSRPSCRTCDCWMTRAGEPAPCELLGGNVAAEELCEGWTPRNV